MGVELPIQVPKVANVKGCWYMTYTTECAICGTGETTRERRLPPAPPKEQRYDYEQYACDWHFL